MNKTRMAGWLATTALSCGPVTTCVARGSRISTPTGPRRVEDLEAGDAVIAVNPLTGESAATHVTALVTSQRECGALTFEQGTLAVTSDHPLFDPVSRLFHPAGDWLLGQRSALLAFDGLATREIAVSARQVFVAVQQVFDLTVAHEWHTFVAEGVVVHNKSIVARCVVPDGGTVIRGASCDCTGGRVGVWSCELDSETSTCAQCGLPSSDGGVLPDGGRP